MACVLVPSVTLYGTTQVSAVRTITHTTTTTYLGEPAITLQTVTSSVCDDAGANCRPEVATSLVTLTPTVTTTIYSTETKSGLVTSVVPQQTLYYPCSTAGPRSSEIAPIATEASRGGSSQGQTPAVAETATTSREGVATSSSSSSSGVNSVAFSTTSQTISEASSTAIVDSATGDVASPLPTTQYPSGSATMTTSQARFSTTSLTPPPQSSASPSGALIAGAVVGAVAALVLLLALITYCRRRRNRASPSSSKSVGTLDYWERRFRELEADGGNDVEKAPTVASAPSPQSPGQSPGTAIGVKKLRLTLDLYSKGISSRPASRLSMISAFFSGKATTTVDVNEQTPAVPVPFTAGQGRSGFNFSRPRFGKRHSTTSGVSRASKASRLGEYGGDVQSSRAGRRSIKSVSTRLRSDASSATQDSSEARTSEGSAVDVGAKNGRRAMEWVRRADHMGDGRRSSDQASGGRPAVSPSGLGVPPKRSTFGTTPTPDDSACERSHKPASGPINSTSGPCTATESTSTASPSSETFTDVSFFAPAPVDFQPSPAGSAAADLPHAGLTATTPSGLATPTSFAAHRRPSTLRKGAPELLSSPDAFVPSLWIDEEVYDQFRHAHEGEGAAASRAEVQTRGSSLSQSDFSMPTLSALPTSGSEDPYGGIARDAPAARPQISSSTDQYDHSLKAYRLRTDSACSSAPPSAAISLAESTATFEDDTASVSFGRAWRSSTARAYARSAVTPQLPAVQLSDSPLFAGAEVGLGAADRGTEERMQTLYHVE